MADPNNNPEFFDWLKERWSGPAPNPLEDPHYLPRSAGELMPPGIRPSAPKAPIGPPAPTPVEDAAEVTPTLDASNEANDQARGIDEWTEAIRPSFGGMQLPQPQIVPSHSNFLPGGGLEGKQNYEDAFVNLPAEISKAVEEGSNAETELGNRQAAFYEKEAARQSQENALIQQRRMQRQQEMELKQKQMEEATVRYTNDLADTGKFWRNPANIVAAIGASLMHLGSDDPTISHRIISKAIETDWNRRKQLADMDLSGKREQLNLYRQIAGDKDLGDRLALIESNRVAAMELERIGAQMRGPIAKARAKAVLKELQRNIAVQQQQLYASMYYNPIKVQNPAIAAQMKKEGMANPGVGPTPYAGAWEASGGGQGAQKAQSERVDGAGAAVLGALRNASGGTSFVDRSVEGQLDLKERPGFDKRAPGSKDLVEMYKRQIAMEAIRKAGPYATKHQLDKIADEIIRNDKEEAKKVAKDAVQFNGKLRGWSAFSNELSRVEADAASLGMDANEMLGKMRDFTPTGWAKTVQTLRQKYSGRDTEEAKQAMKALDRSERLHQLLGMKIVDFFHENGGTALSKTELENLQQVISHSSNWQQIRNFSDQKSREMGQLWNALLSQAGGERSATLLRIMYGQNPNAKIDSPGAQKNVQGAVKQQFKQGSEDIRKMLRTGQ